jgi:hypothetical protein
LYGSVPNGRNRAGEHTSSSQTAHKGGPRGFLPRLRPSPCIERPALLATTELRAKAVRLRKRARSLGDPREAANLRAMAHAYDLMADHRANDTHPWAPECRSSAATSRPRDADSGPEAGGPWSG